MTREEKAKILDYAIERAYREVEAATGAEMDTMEFHTLLTNINEMERLLERATVSCYVQPETPMQQSEPTIGDTEKPEPEKPAEPEPEKPTGDDSPQYKMEEVRAALAKARGKGVNVSEIIASFGVSSFPQIAKEQYPAVMRALEERGA